jgi:signal transduction histidine kinase
LWIRIAQVPGRIEFNARDDGCGTEAIQPGHGLRGMLDRIRGLGGDLQIASKPGEGFMVDGWLPMTGPRAGLPPSPGRAA